MPPISPRKWKAGDKFSASHLNESLDILAMASPLFSGDEELQTSLKGTSVNKGHRVRFGQIVPIYLTSVGAVAGLYNARVPLVHIRNPDTATAISDVKYGVWPAADNAWAWYINDITTGTSSQPVPSYGYARVTGFFNGRFVFDWIGSSGGSTVRSLQIIAHGGGFGWYQVSERVLNNGGTPWNTAAAVNIGTNPTPTAMAFNLKDLNNSGVGVRWGLDPNPTGTPIFTMGELSPTLSSTSLRVYIIEMQQDKCG